MEGVLKTLKKKNEELKQKSHDYIDSFEPSTDSTPDSPIFKEMSAELKNVQAEIDHQKVEQGERVVEMVSIFYIGWLNGFVIDLQVIAKLLFSIDFFQ